MFHRGTGVYHSIGSTIPIFVRRSVKGHVWDHKSFTRKMIMPLLVLLVVALVSRVIQIWRYKTTGSMDVMGSWVLVSTESL